MHALRCMFTLTLTLSTGRSLTLTALMITLGPRRLGLRYLVLQPSSLTTVDRRDYDIAVRRSLDGPTMVPIPQKTHVLNVVGRGKGTAKIQSACFPVTFSKICVRQQLCQRWLVDGGSTASAVARAQA